MAKISKKLVGSVLVANPAGGDPLVLRAGDDVPEGIELGDHVLEPEKAPKTDKSPKGGAKKAEKAAKSAKAPASEPAPTGDELAVPPLTGAGSSAAAWRQYAIAATAKAGLQIEFADDAKRADIIAALQTASIPTE